MSMHKREDRTHEGAEFRRVLQQGGSVEEANNQQRIYDLRSSWEATTRKENLDEIDSIFIDGEGVILTDSSPGGYWLGIGNFRWIRVYSDDKKPRAIATFYLRTDVDTGVLIDMTLARARKGLPPNPLDVMGLSFSPLTHSSHVAYSDMREDYLEFSESWERRQRAYLPDIIGSQGVKGLRPTVRVQVIPSDDFDHRWQFPGFKIRSTRLAPILLAFRNAGIQRVSVADIQNALNRT